MKRALICGIGGQDGGYLARLLLEKGYRVAGTSRDIHRGPLANLETLGIANDVELLSMAPNDFRSVFTALVSAEPDEIYHLAGQSSVGLSFEMPAETLDSIVFGTLNLLEAIRLTERPIKFYHASSSECFGDLHGEAATEHTPFRPRSPYGVAKASAHMLVANYREAYGLFAANGILFNHESPLRPERFVTRKITAAAARIAAGSPETLTLGRTDIIRDWGWAPDYVDAMWRMLQIDEAQDFVIATGRSISLAQFAELAFDAVGLNWRDHVRNDESFARPSDLLWSGADPSHAMRELGWKASVPIEEVARRMVEADRAKGEAATKCEADAT
ncbi:GDP-mannose 4,6-dehydratase [Croceicoccus sp. YJ47]|uniref:GDP-mannose 4,6-dehydratase n=1 Tax=Croceicoccus sp. YJ47 TaxID=2798724 RepID=UPI00192042EB|nr:GDP-mannose 4,6-dehydratase [Croceicoccus sp. YJ47]QQN72998.1 GDP-mannose 4,6-dehydratase [Croceicoccus sp. YJ47]